MKRASPWRPERHRRVGRALPWVAIPAAVALTAWVGIDPGAGVSRPIIPGFERFADSTVHPHLGGELLLSELRCVSCHAPEAGLEDRYPVLPGPRLEGIGQRVQYSWLVDWLADPHAVKPGATMPDLLAGKDAAERREIAKALADYLFSLDGEPIPKSPPAGSIENGRRLFHTASCVACHSPRADFKPNAGLSIESLEVPSVPLGDIGAKYTRDGLIAFLRDPVKYRPAGRMPRTPMDDSELADLVAYLLDGREDEPGEPPRLGSLVATGREHFASLNCVQCHEPGSRKSRPLQSFARLADLSGRSHDGCLSGSPPEGTPAYPLSAEQRQAIRDALKNAGSAEAPGVAERAERMMRGLNCYACHQRDGRGGPLRARAAFFESTADDLGDEGRIPPPLTGIGRKLTRPASEEAIRGGQSIREYMVTRMPDFGAEHAELLASLLEEIDVTPDIAPTPRDGQEDQVGRGIWGRELVGTGGLACIACHDLSGQRSLGIRAVDLALAPERLRPEWFRDFLLDPVAYRPNTRMPAFWPEGKAVHPLIGRDTQRQIDSIWAYLNEIEQSRLPEGMEEKGSFELKPDDAPIVFRTFMKEAGFRAIAVGFPQKIHAAFDAGEARWAILWRGAFLDAEGTWSDRFSPLAEPLGTDVVRFPTGTGFPGERRFGGYRLDARGVPAFLYRTGELEVEDRIEPDGDGLVRVLTVRGGSERTWFCVAMADEVVERNGTWIVDGLRLRLRGANEVETSIVPHDGKKCLSIAIDFDRHGNATLHMEIDW